MKHKTFIARDGMRLACRLWDNVKNPVGVVQLIHGMDEHTGRYDRFARFLNQHGYIVFGDDHRAHGRTVPHPRDIGKTGGAADLFADTMHDEIEIFCYLQSHFDVPVFIFAHSYGSFIAQRMIQMPHFCAAGVCLSGTAKYPGILVRIARAIAWIGCRTKGPDAPAKFLERFSPIRPGKNGESKLTRDRAQAAAHDADPLRAEYFSYGFYYALFSNMRPSGRVHCRTIPVLIIGGGADAVGGNGRFARRLFRAYRREGMPNVQIRLYPGARHELLLETNYAQVQDDVLQWLRYAQMLANSTGMTRAKSDGDNSTWAPM